MRASYKKALKYILFLVPGVLGFVGLYILDRPGETLGDALYHTLKLYVFSYSDSPCNMLVEIARWTAPLCTASGIALAIAAARDRLRRYLCYRSGKAVAVYGPSASKNALLAQLGKRGLDGHDRFIRAQRYILLQDEDEAFSFYERYRGRLAEADVFLKCSSLKTQSVSDHRLHLFCPEETSARIFWKQRELYRQFSAAGAQGDIVLLGFGKLGEEVLTYALLDNIFSPSQHIEYHVFGDGSRFSAVHPQLAAVTDPVLFHAEPWYEQMDLLEQADMVLVLEQDDQLALLRDLLLATRRSVIDVFAADRHTLGFLDSQDRLKIFDWKQEGLLLDNICSDRLIDLAKRINLRYANLYMGVPETAAASEAEWAKLDTFTRYSNISAADYHDIRLALLTAAGQSADPEKLSPETWDLLAELEHIRWMRYHFLHNWRYGVPEGGGTKDAVHRIHADLLPYPQLPEKEKDKDRQSARLLLELDDRART